MSQLGSEGFSQNQKNILQNIQANIINYTPTQIIQIVREVVTQRPLIKASPYKGLYKFNAGDKDKFFGRDALIQGFLNDINSSPLSLILGASGSGKSSVIRAGVIPRLKQLLVGVTFYDFIVEPGENPFTSLYNSFLNNEKDYHFNASDVAFLCDNSSETFPKVIKQLKKADEYWLLFIDQFEQVFTNCRDVQMRDNFIDGLVQVANLRDSSVKIVLAMRADFSEYLSAYPVLGEILNQNNIHLVTDMHPDELRQVIEQPAAQHGVVFEEGLVEQIIKDVQGQSGSLPLLQYALQLLWEEECKLIAADGRPHIEDRTLNTFNYNVLEGVRGALQKHINYIYQKQNEEEKLATKQIFLRLVRIDETDSGSRAVSQIASRSDFVGVSQEKVLENLINKNLLVSDSKYLNKEDLVTHINTKREQVATVELAHEILLSSWDTLRGWLEEEKQAIILRNWLADEAKRWNKIKKEDESKAKNELVRSSRLDEIVAFREADRFSKLGGLIPIENEYIDASVEYRDFLARQEEERRQKELKQARRIAIGASVGGTIMFGLASFAVFSAWNAMKQKEKAILSDIEATMSNSDSLLKSGQPFKAFIESLKGASKLKDSSINDSNNNIKRNLSISIQNSMNQISNLYNKLEAHAGPINSVSFSPDGEMIASGGFKNKVKLWNRQGKLLHTLNGHTSSVNSVNFSPDSKTLISGSDDTVKLWNLQGNLLKTIITSGKSVSFSPDGEMIASGGYDNKVKLWSRQGKLLYTLTGHTSYVNSVSFSPDGNTVISGSDDGTVKLWNLQGELLSTLTGYRETVNNGNIYSDTPSNTEYRQLDNNQIQFKSVSISPDGNIIAGGTSNGEIYLWNLKDKSLRSFFTGHSIISFSKDGQTIVSGGNYIAEDGNYYGGGVVSLYNLEGKFLKNYTPDNSNYQVNSISISPDGKIASGQDGGGIVNLWNPQANLVTTINNNMNSILGGPLGNGGVYKGVSMSSDREIIASTSQDNKIRLWNRQGKLINILEGHTASIENVNFSPDGKFIVSGSSDNKIKLWSKEGNLLKTINGHTNGVNSVSLSNNGSIIVSGGGDDGDNTIKIWDNQGNLLKTIIDPQDSGYADYVTYLNISPDGEIIASSSLYGHEGEMRNTIVKLWNREGQLINSLIANNVAFSPDAKTIASAHSDGAVKIWNRQGKLLNTLKGNSIFLESVSFSPDGENIVATTADNQVRIWNHQGKLLSSSTIIDNSLISIASIDLDRGTVISIDEKNNIIKLWNLNLKEVEEKSCEHLHDYLITNPDVLTELTVCQNPSIRKEASSSLMIEGENLVKNELIDDAISKFSQAKQWNHELNIKPKDQVKQIQNILHLKQEGEELAKKLDIDGAIVKFQEFLKLNSQEIFDPKDQAQSLAFTELTSVNGNKQLFKEASIEKIIAIYKENELLRKIEYDDWHKLCWNGSLRNYAPAVLFACEKAVSLYKEGTTDSRGIARAMTDNLTGAIEDFEFSVSKSDDSYEGTDGPLWRRHLKHKSQLAQWISDLKAGKNPFTPELRKQLLDDDFVP